MYTRILAVFKKDKAREYNKKWRAEHEEHLKAKIKIYRAKNEEKIKNYHKVYHKIKYKNKEYKERLKRQSAAWGKSNPERRAFLKKQWRAANPDKVEKDRAQGRARRNKNVEHFRLKSLEWGRNNKERCKENAKKWKMANMEQYKQRMTDYRIKNKDRIREYRKLNNRTMMLKNEYGITQNDYDTMLISQNGVCAICKGQPNGVGIKTNVFSIDHDHQTGQVRGLLCNRCNTGIGFLKDSTETLESAIIYLKSTKGRMNNVGE